MGEHLLKLPSFDGALVILGITGRHETEVPVVSGAWRLEDHCLYGDPTFQVLG